MSDLIREYKDFIDELRADYLSRGFRIIPADETSSKLGFQPDLVVAQDGEVTVIEVKSMDRAPLARINDLRKRVERLGYRFELKVVPRVPKKRAGPEHTTKVPQLLSDAEEFFKADRLDLALLLSWIALEISIRVLDARMTDAQEPVTSTGDLVRTATELELISEEELTDVRAIAELRNRVVHGFETEVPRRLIAQAIELARRIAKEAKLTDT
jgi:uncharacterized protein YutE (UPF0331/DUF86 family)